MEDLIIKYLTDKLNKEEMSLLQATMRNDEKFRNEFRHYLAALALTDYSLDYAPADIENFRIRKETDILPK